MVEVNYNGDEKAFEIFLKSILKNYISEDPTAPETDDKNTS